MYSVHVMVLVSCTFVVLHVMVLDSCTFVVVVVVQWTAVCIVPAGVS